VSGAAWREAHLGEHEERSSRARPGAKRWNAPRSSCERISLRGAVRDRRPQRRLVARSRETGRPVRATSEKGSALQRSARTTTRCAAWFEEGLAPPKDEANLHSRQPGPRSCASSEAPSATRQPVRSPSHSGKGAAEGEGHVRGSHLSWQYEERCSRGWCSYIARIAEVGRAPSGPEKHVTGTERVESLCGHHGARERGLSHGQPHRA